MTGEETSRKKSLRWLLTAVLVWSGSGATAQAGTLAGIISSSGDTSIGKILEHPEVFHLQLVQMEGMVREIEVLQPHPPYQPGDPCFGAYLFTLDDTTGTLRIGVQGHRMNCGVAIGDERPEIREGERIHVKAQIHAPGVYIDKMTAPWPIHQTITQAIAVHIIRLGKSPP